MRSTEVISSVQLRELEADIRSELARIERSLASDAESDAMITDGASVRVASGSASDGGLSVTLNGRTHARLVELTEALRRIEDGRYGVCGHCGESIAYGRLLVVPEATTCLVCR